MGSTKWWSTLNTRRERTSEVLRGPCRVCYVMDWCGPRRCSSPEAAAWWSDRHQCPKPLDFFILFPIQGRHVDCWNKKKKKLELEAARRSARGGAAMTSAVQEPATATIDEAVASISFSAVAFPSTTMPAFFPVAVDGAVL